MPAPGSAPPTPSSLTSTSTAPSLRATRTAGRAGLRVADDVGQRLGDDEVRGRLDRDGQLRVGGGEDLDRHRGAACQPFERCLEAVVAEHRRVDAAGELAQLGGRLVELRKGFVQQLAGRGRVVVELAAHQAQAHGQRHQPLLGAVVEVALDPAAFLVPGLDDAGARGAQLGYLRLQLGGQLEVLGGQGGADLLLAADPRAQQADQEGEGEAGEDRHRGDEGAALHRGRSADRAGDQHRDQQREGEAAGCEDGGQGTALVGGAAPPTPVEDPDHGDDHRDRDQGLDGVDRLGHRLVALDQKRVFRAAIAAFLSGIDEQAPGELHDRGDEVGRSDENLLEARFQRPAGEGDEQVDQERERQRRAQDPDREHDLAVGGAERLEEPGEADHGHQGAGVVAGTAIPGVEAGSDEAPGGDQNQGDDHAARALVVAGHDHGDRPDAECEGERPEADQRSPQTPHPINAARVAPVSSPLVTKPCVGLSASRSPKSELSRVEVRTIAERPPAARRRSATSNPSMSGSWTSSRTRSGPSSLAGGERRGSVLGLADDRCTRPPPACGAR